MRDPLLRASSAGARASPPIRVVPHPVVASPADLHAAHDPDVHPAVDDEQWWTPGWVDVSRAIGWWWLVLAPSLIVLLAGTLVPLALGWWGLILPGLIGGLKTAAFLIAVVIAIVGYGIAHATASRKDCFCIHCGYGLDGLDDLGSCPECGRPFSRRMSEEYRRDPRFFRERYRAARRPPPNAAPVISPNPDAPPRASADGT